MKKHFILFPFGILVTLVSCVNYYQLYKINPEASLKTEKQFIVYENDTLSVTYNFWAEKGVLSFAIFNKTNKPLYIDWKKSSYILNLQKLNFWVDETSIEVNSTARTHQRSTYDNYIYQGINTQAIPYQYIGQTNEYSSSYTKTSTSGIQRKQERITFIAPNSFVSNSRYIILKDKIIYGDKSLVRSYKSPKDSIFVYRKKYTESNSPLKFNVFLTFATNENFDNELYILNKFYLSEIVELPDKEYFASDIYQDANYFYFSYPAGENLSNSGYYW